MKRWALLTVAAATSALFAHPSASSGIAPAAQGATGNARIVVKVLLSQTQSVSVAAGETKQLAVTYKGGV